MKKYFADALPRVSQFIFTDKKYEVSIISQLFSAINKIFCLRHSTKALLKRNKQLENHCL